MNLSIFNCSFVFGIVLLAGCETALLSTPTNKLALANERVEFQCSSDSGKSLKWSVMYADTTENIDLVRNGNFTARGKSKYRIYTGNPGQCNLIIDSVDFSYAGKYKCTQQPFGPDVEAKLGVVDSQPVCRTNASSGRAVNAVLEKEYLEMMCRLNFSGNITLRMNWFRISTGGMIHNASNGRNQSRIVIQVDSSDNGETFMFKATFTQVNNSNETVVTWNSTVTVYYSPRNLVIKPDSSVYTVGDQMECLADGNPTPDYEWTDAGTNRTINGSVLAIEAYMRPDQNHTFKCAAYNTVAGMRNHTAATVTFSVPDATQSNGSNVIKSQTLLIIGIVSVSVLISCLLVALLIYNKDRKVTPENLNSSRETSIQEQEQDYEMVDELNLTPGDFGNPSLNNRTLIQTNNELYSPENIDCGGYASLRRSPSATLVQPAVYSNLHLYVNISINDN